MNFSFSTKTFRNLLGENFNQLVIPRFQRDFSWEEDHISEFLHDLISNINCNDSNKESPYFFGTILIVGDMNNSNKSLEIVDGQQRLTTATILLSVIAKLLKDNDREDLATLTWKYIIGKNDNGEEFTILINDTLSDFFKENVQDLDKTISDTIKNKEIPDKEAERIFSAIKWLSNTLDIKNINRLSIDGSDYINSLTLIRDALLNSQVVCISTTDKENANLIFEILNSKGKKLEDIDLIKNKLFKTLNKTQPKDFANSQWKLMKNHLTERGKIELSTFYRHFWLSQHKRKQNLDLYEQFKKEIKPTNYELFLKDLLSSAELYKKIIYPNLELDFMNKQENKCIVNSLKYLNSFNIKQSRIALLSLFKAKENNLITSASFKKILFFLPKFHFAYNSLCKKPTNAIEAKYATFSVKISKITDRNKLGEEIDNFISTLKKILPPKNEFIENFTKLTYSSKNNDNSNVLAKYAISEIEKELSTTDYIPDNYTIEHIIPEGKDSDDNLLNIGNLTFLEKNINSLCSDKNPEDKLPFYARSNSEITKKFIENHKHFPQSEIKSRANSLAELLYKIIKN